MKAITLSLLSLLFRRIFRKIPIEFFIRSPHFTSTLLFYIHVNI